MNKNIYIRNKIKQNIANKETKKIINDTIIIQKIKEPLKNNCINNIVYTNLNIEINLININEYKTIINTEDDLFTMTIC
jgi:hypothetical protein